MDGSFTSPDAPARVSLREKVFAGVFGHLTDGTLCVSFPSSHVRTFIGRQAPERFHATMHIRS